MAETDTLYISYHPALTPEIIQTGPGRRALIAAAGDGKVVIRQGSAFDWSDQYKDYQVGAIHHDLKGGQ